MSKDKCAISVNRPTTQLGKLPVMAISVSMLIGSSGVFSAPTELIIDVSEKKITYHAIGGSRVEYKWPKSGVVCEHDTTSSARVCDNLRPDEHYQIVDLHDNKRGTFYLLPDAPMKDGICLAGAT